MLHAIKRGKKKKNEENPCAFGLEYPKTAGVTWRCHLGHCKPEAMV